MEELYKIYKLNDEIFKFYIQDTKRGKNCTKECVERKIFAMMLAAPLCLDNGIGCKRYQFGSFNILVRQDSDEIGMVYWTKKSSFVSKENSQNLHNLYKLLGLSEDGQIIETDIDEINLLNYIKENNLTNLGDWSDYYKTPDEVLDFSKEAL